MMAEPTGARPDVRHANESAERLLEGAARRQLLDWRAIAPRAHVKVENLFPHRNQKAKVPLLTRVFLRDLQLNGLVALFQSPEQRRGRLAHLEVDRPVFYLQYNVVVELAVQSLKIVVRRRGPVVLRIAPVHVVVIHEAAIEDDASMRLERPRNYIRRIGMGAFVERRPEPSLRIRLEHEAAEVGNRGVDLVNRLRPPIRNRGFERVERRETAHLPR